MRTRPANPAPTTRSSLSPRPPSVAVQPDSAVCIELHALRFQGTALNEVAAGLATLADLAPGVNDAVPWDFALIGQCAERVAHESGVAAEPGDFGDLAVGRDPPPWDAPDDGVNAFMSHSPPPGATVSVARESCSVA